MVFSLAWHMLRDRGRAEDIAQEAFLRLSSALPRLETEAHVRFWLRQVTSRLCIDELRRQPGRPLSLEVVEEPGEEPRDRDFLLDERLRRLVGELPAKARMAVVLRYQEDLDIPEIAALLREPLPTVKSRLRRALASLKEALGLETGGTP